MNVLSRFRRAGRPAHSRLADAVLPAIVALTAGAGAASPPPAPAPVTTGEPPKKKITRAEAFEAAVQLMAKSTGRNVDEVRQHLQALRASPTPPPPPAPVQQNDTPADVIALAKRRKEDLVSLQGIYSLGEDFVMLGLKENWDTETAQQKATEFLTNKARPLNVHVSPDNNLVSLRSSIGDAIRLRAGAKIEKPHERADKLRALSLLDMGRHYLSAIGHPDAWTLGRSTLVGLLVNPRELRAQPGGGQMVMLAESVGDFPGILKDAINKTLIQAYRDASPTWKQWARRATAPDFKTINRVNLS
ncbi:MAG TPA: hypothetical protein VG406_24235, partial [Isosphaeraceae bacterium]|nr:hypothetical protein [Isosphaeraceae bacterium]